MRVLILGVTGMLGNAVYNSFRQSKLFEVWGTLRQSNGLAYFPSNHHPKLISNVDVLNQDDLIRVFETVKPQIIINCIGVIKQLSTANDPLVILPVNSLFPHRLAKLCALFQARLIHISTDCVFSGNGTGDYVESDLSDAEDLYGKSKFIGEVIDSSHVITLRTSIIGHELNSHYALVDWFLSQKGQVKGYTHAIYSGLPTIELSEVIQNHVIPNQNLNGLYHVATSPISKFNLLKLIADVYNKEIIIEPDNTVAINRSLCASRFEEQTGYTPPDWPILIEKMYQSKKKSGAI
jgi:dTDP-4-dehydrorhamnose reductase